MAYEIGHPYDTGVMPTGDGHHIYWELYGHPQGKPAVVLHGGPGSGATPYWRQFFDPGRYRVVLFDQRGCGRSLPNAGDDVSALENNTTADLIRDLEALRRLHSIKQWLVFGASWGSTLGLSYAVRQPHSISELVLWAVVLTRSSDVHWITNVMGDVYPHEFDHLLLQLPAYPKDGNIPLAFNQLLRSPDPIVADAAARAWCGWEDRIATLNGPVVPSRRSEDPRLRLGFARLVTHYFGNFAFQRDDAITGSLDRIAHIPTFLLRGRLDVANPLRAAYEVAQGLSDVTLEIVENEGHGAGEETTARLVAVLDKLASE
ncbi:proline iminopeptidase [Kribbella sp. VKM Ac-2571]|nr:proline iminopeptidase [Kribbella sp. VKM Ac-2571]